MREKEERLFVQKTQRQEDTRQNKLPLPLLSLLLQIFFNVNFSTRYLQATLPSTLSVTYNFLFIFFDRKFYCFL